MTTKSFEELEKRYLATYKTPKEAKKYVDALYLVAQKGTDKQRIAKALYRKGYIYLKLGNTKAALQFTEESLANKSHDDDKLLFQNLVQKGNIFLAEGKYDSSIHFYLKGRVVAQKIGSTRDILAMTTNVALIKKQIEDYTGAIYDFKGTLTEIEKLNSPIYNRLEIANHLGLADTYLRILQPDAALIHTNKGLLKTSPETYANLHTDLLLNRVIIKYQKQQYQQSIDLAISLDTLIKNTEQPRKFVTSYLYQAKSYNALKLVDSAIFQYENIKNLAKIEAFSFPELEEVYYQLAKMYLQKKDTKSATHNFELFEEFNQQKDSSNIVVHHTIKDYDIAQLKEELRTVNEKSTQQKKTVNYLYVISSVLVGFTIFFLILYRRNKNKNKKRFSELLIRMQQLETEKKKPKTITHKTDLAINDEGVVQILKDLSTFEAKQSFLHVDCTLAYTAKKLKTNTAYLSHVINTYKGKTFTAYLNDLRIDTALVTLKNDKKIRLYSMKAIANEFGYKRRETFSKVFKSTTGMDPTSYIKELQLKDKNRRDNS
ncbi:AraC family transcriptional regulator [Kordia sp. YSTF-M3]|uniref:AraC family transcriptional regulator n=1 Tax=Kordia aestuariivivens TaxID=2759037 RepID=A0ABR7Q6E5_9FLAO|nr:helix-turn-helix domain-containing protein [Kordia aestuariivivens]MBC8754142.1 AraC family transcriptional regulator [Kordia aestuariivivens]